jgi:hypothetical protein
VLLDSPSIGVAKTAFLSAHGPLGDHRGATADIVDGGEVIGRALRTRDGVRPVYVSVGYRVGLDTACDLVLALAPRHPGTPAPGTPAPRHPGTVSRRPAGTPIPLPGPRCGKRSAKVAHLGTGSSAIDGVAPKGGR